MLIFSHAHRALSTLRRITRSDQLVALFVLCAVSTTMYAQDDASATLTTAGTTLQGGFALVANLLGAAVILVAIIVIIASLIQVSRERATIGDVVLKIVAAGVVAAVVGGLITLANTNIAAIGTTS